MPKGELYFRLHGDKNTWVDMYDDTDKTYGVSFSDTGISKLMTPPPKKGAIENKSRRQNGKRIIMDSSYSRKDERTIDIEMHLSAPDKGTFWTRYRDFCKDWLEVGFFDIKHKDIGEDTIFRVEYVNCTQFSEFNQELAKFTLRLNEPDPSNRGTTDAWDSATDS